MGFLTRPSTQTVDPTADAVKPLQGGLAQLLLGLTQNPGSNPFEGLTSDLQRQATGGMQQFLGANPEQQVMDLLQPGLLEIFGRNNAASVGEAAFPLFQRGLQEGLGSLASSAPGRFSTAFEGQGIGLAQRALQDFNLLQQQAFQQNVGNQLGAGSLLGTLASQAGQGAFGRNLQAGQLGLAQTQQNVNPVLQLLLGALGFAQPQPKETIVGKSAGSRVGGAASGALGGAAVGSTIPGVGTLAGGILGGLGGLLR